MRSEPKPTRLQPGFLHASVPDLLAGHGSGVCTGLSTGAVVIAILGSVALIREANGVMTVILGVEATKGGGFAGCEFGVS